MMKLTQIERFAKAVPLEAVRSEFLAVLHKLRYPMTKIIQKVPGETLAERARAIGVSRQTVYVWLDERFRPIGQQATKLADLTGFPVEQIKEYQNDAGRTAAKKAARVAGGRKDAPESNGRTRAGRRRVVASQGRSKAVREARGGDSG